MHAESVTDPLFEARWWYLYINCYSKLQLKLYILTHPFEHVPEANTILKNVVQSLYVILDRFIKRFMALKF